MQIVRNNHNLVGTTILCRLLLGVLICGSSSGCNWGYGPQSEVTGVVTLEGELLKAGKVTFFPENKPGRSVGGHIQPDGRFKIPFVPSGPAKVTVQVLPEKNRSRPTGRKQQLDLPPIAAKYQDPETTDLAVKVSGQSQDFVFDLLPE